MSDQPLCLFCKDEATDASSVEHLIPKALGGWLATRDVCKSCNDFFGHAIEKFVDHPLLLGLRQEAGLEINREERWEFYDVQSGAVVPGRLTADGVEPLSPVYRDGSRVLVRGSPDEVQAIVERIRNRAEKEGRNFEVQPLKPFEPHIVRLRKTGVHEDPRPLIKRDAAKIAVEYVAFRGGRQLAFDPRVESLIECALTGEASDRIQVGYFGPTPLVRLISQQRLLHLGPTDSQPETPEDRRAYIADLLPEPMSATRPDLNQFPAWPGFEHRIELVREGSETAYLELTLFTAIMVRVPLAPTLPLPWGAADSRDLLTRRTRRVYPR